MKLYDCFLKSIFNNQYISIYKTKHVKKLIYICVMQFYIKIF